MKLTKYLCIANYASGKQRLAVVRTNSYPTDDDVREAVAATAARLDTPIIDEPIIQITAYEESIILRILRRGSSIMECLSCQGYGYICPHTCIGCIHKTCKAARECKACQGTGLAPELPIVSITGVEACPKEV